MRKQNFKSDFDFILTLKDNEGNDVGFPDINWELLLLTSSRQLAYTASHQYGENVNCFDDGGKIHVTVDRHEFPVGELLYELTVEIPNEDFGDGSRKVFVKGSTDIEMVNENGQTLTGVIVEVRVPHLKKEVEEEEGSGEEPSLPEGGEPEEGDPSDNTRTEG